MGNSSGIYNYYRAKTASISFCSLKNTERIMAEKKKFLLRIDDKTYSALEKWAADDFRSINAQIEYLLKEALKKSGRIKAAPDETPTNEDET